MFVTRLKSNLKGSIDLPEMRPKVLIIGRNGAGKSSIVDAYSLVTTGAAFTAGLGKGREVSKEGSADGAEVFIEAALSDGTTLHWPTGPLPTDGLNVQEASRQVLYGDSAALQRAVSKAVVPFVGGQWDSVVEQIRQFVPDAFLSSLTEVLQAIKNKVGQGTDLTTIASYAMEYLSSEIRANTKAMSAVASTHVVPLSPEEHNEMNMLAPLAALVPPFDVERHLHREVTRGNLVRQTLQEATTEWQAAKDRLNQPGHNEVDTAIPRLVRELLQKMIGDANVYQECPVCGGGLSTHTLPECPTCLGSLTPARLRERLQHVNQLVEAATLLGEAKRVAASAEAQAARKVQALSTELDEIKKAVTTLLPFRGVGRTPTELSTRLEVLRSRASALTANAALQQSVAEIGKRKETMQALLESMRAMHKKVADDAVDIVTIRINRLLPPRIRVRFEHTKKGGSGYILRVTLDGGVETSFRLLGGAERALVTLALAAATSQPATGVVSAIIDDVGLDKRSIKLLIAATDEIIAQGTGPSQVLLSVLSYPAENVPDDWTVIRLAEPKTVLKAVSKAESGSAEIAPTLLVPLEVTPTKAPAGSASESPDVRPQGSPRKIGEVSRAGFGTVAVYWLGRHGRMTSSTYCMLAHGEGVTDGALGVALSGKKKGGALKVAVYQGGLALPMPLVKPELATALKNMISSQVLGDESAFQID